MDDTTTSATYAELFPEQVADKCASDALEANIAPLAYLHALYKQALSLEANGDTASQIKLADRRPDIEEQVLDQGSLENQLPALTLVIDAMERKAKSHAGQNKDLAEEIAKAQYPAQLPFHLPLEQIKSVLKQKKTSLFDLLQRSHYSYPNFTSENLRTDELREVMLNAAGFSPALRSMLLDYRATTSSDYLQTLYGVTDDATKILDQLPNVDFLSRQTGLTPESILELLAISGVPDDGTESITAVKQSKAYTAAAEKDAAPIAGHIYGAVFINNATAPALALEDIFQGPGINLRIKGASAERFSRIHKMIHLQHALQIPFAQVDLLVMAALRAEGQTKDFHFTQNTLRALGVFCYMRDEYRVTAEQFAALINGLTPYAVGEETPFLDRVLDGPGAGQMADTSDWLKLDGREFDISVTTQTSDSLSKSPIGMICRAFALEERVANVYLTQAVRALGRKKPALSLPVFSSLYRLTRLPRLLKLSMDEGTSVIALLAESNPRVWTQLAGKPELTQDELYYEDDGSDEVNTEAGECDILDVLAGVINLEKWLRRQRISAQALLSWLIPLPADISAELKPLYRVDARIQQTLIDALPRIGASLLTETQIAQEVGPAVLPASGSWLNALSAFLDARGLVKAVTLAPKKNLADMLGDELKGKLKSANGLLLQVSGDIDQVKYNLERLITNATIAQEDVVKHILSNALAKDEEGRALTPGHALALLRWVEETRFTLLADVLAAQGNASSTAATLEGLNLQLWDKLVRHAQVIKCLQLSPAGLTTLLDHPGWFELAGDTDSQDQSPSHPPALSLDLCYQVGCYRAWIDKCQSNGFAEDDALDYFAKLPSNDQTGAPLQAAKQLGKLIGWPESETALALPFVKVSVASLTKTFDSFLRLLSPSEMNWYKYCEKNHALKGLGAIIERYLNGQRTNTKDPKVAQIYDKFVQFLKDNPGTLKVSKDQYLPTTKPTWTRITDITPVESRSQIKLEVYPPDNSTAETEYTYIHCVPSVISDIDFILQQQSLCEKTGMSCRSLLDLSLIDSDASFNDVKNIAQILMGACSDEELAAIQPTLREQWRDALAAYLLGYWATSSPSLKSFIANNDDLSSYFLTDVWVSSAVNTSIVIQATASLQHYLHRLFSRLDPGYASTIITQETSDFWRQYLSEYGTWKIWRAQLNHPENLIYYANRPKKSTAFQSLEVELNQGKLDPALLQTVITGYLTKFEQTSNLQIVSGYLDGVNPKNDTYHFIGKTNTSPPEYYWRSVDMGLRDDKERLSPLAWTEWEKIGIAPSGQITQSSYQETASDKTVLKHACDTIRPVMIEGRPYVFWVERGSVGLPSSDKQNQTPTKFKKLSVQYIYKQSDGFWSPPNELMSLDGTKDGKRLDDMVDDESSTEKVKPKIPNPYLKDDTYEPGLIALVNVEGARAQDPWLTVMLYDCAKPTETTMSPGKLDSDYFIQSRDLLLIDKKILSPEELAEISLNIYTANRDIRTVQYPYGIVRLIIKPIDTEKGAWSTTSSEAITAIRSDSSDDTKSDHILDDFHFPTSPPDTATAEIKSSADNTLTINSQYRQKILSKKVVPTIFLSQLVWQGTINGARVSINYREMNIALFSEPSHIVQLDIVSAGDTPPQLGYSVIVDGKEKASPLRKALKGNKTSLWTCALEVDKAEYLIDNDFKIVCAFPGQTISRPLQLSINPDAFAEVTHAILYYNPNSKLDYMSVKEKTARANGKSILSCDFLLQNLGNTTFTLEATIDDLVVGYSSFSWSLEEMTVEKKWDISIKRNEQQAQYLDLNAVADQPPTFPTNTIRLNTLFGKQLVSRASRSVERALEWDAQLLKEPTIDPAIPNPSVDFHGANGIYFRELFLHLPNLVATRLSEQQQFDEAERWFTEYLFDPFRALPDEKQRPPFWNTRPLAEVGAGISKLQKVVNPTTKAFILSRYNRQAVFLSMVENWQRQGDHFYRELTPSALNHAWLSYQKALKLIGPLPERASVSRWVPTPLKSVDASLFRAPINERVIQTRKTIEHRLFNLRHGLTIDGKLLPIMDWRTEGADPFGFAQRGIGHLISSYNSDRMQVPAYRFRQLIPMARAAVQQLQDMGRHYMKLMEDEFNTTLSVLLKQQEIRISDFTLKLQQEAINSVKAKRNTLLLSKQAAVFRSVYYTNLIDIGRSPMEEAATGLIYTAAYVKASTAPFSFGVGVADSFPCIFGVSTGRKGNAEGLSAAIGVLNGLSAVSKFTSEQLLMESGYERRANEWKFELKQAELDIQFIDLQVKETNIELNAATISLDMARADRQNLEEAHVAMTTGFTIIPIYNWLVARQELVYGPAYDAVLSLCLSAEAAWRYEIGDYKRPAFVKTSAWIDSYKGMLAGESLLVDLQEMENAYLQSNERRLTIKKTINIWEAQTDSELKALKALQSTPLTFDIKSVEFDRNYPGHYLRQLKHVSVSFVMASDASDAMKEVSAILTQTDSTTLVEPAEDGADYLYAPSAKPPASVKRNLRAQQQIALSSGAADDGLGFGPGDWVYELMFHDGRYLPFEGTGAISRWQLSFPDENFVKSLVDGDKALVKSIQLHMVYTAVDGGKDFTVKVKTLRDKA